MLGNFLKFLHFMSLPFALPLNSKSPLIHLINILILITNARELWVKERSLRLFKFEEKIFGFVIFNCETIESSSKIKVDDLFFSWLNESAGQNWTALEIWMKKDFV